jgi:hypothetical protein
MKRRNRYPQLTPLQWRRRHIRGNPSKLADLEIRRFVHKALKTMTDRETAEACREKFGPIRAPAESTITRYRLTLKDLRKGAGKPCTPRS